MQMSLFVYYCSILCDNNNFVMRLKPQAEFPHLDISKQREKQKRKCGKQSDFTMVCRTCLYRLEYMGKNASIYSHVDEHVTFVLSVDASDEQNTYTHSGKSLNEHDNFIT